MMVLHKILVEKWVADMVMISDGRMSVSAYGTVVRHVSPEAAVGGGLALVKDGDWIELDVAGRRLHLDVGSAELEKRKKIGTKPAPPHRQRRYNYFYSQHVAHR